MSHTTTPLYEKCLHCHLFIEPNTEQGPGLAEHLHLHRDDEADRLIDESHEATPSGLLATLGTWKAFGPLAMRLRFDDFTPADHPQALVTDDGCQVVLTTHPNERELLSALRQDFAVGDEVADEDLVQFVCDKGVLICIDSI